MKIKANQSYFKKLDISIKYCYYSIIINKKEKSKNDRAKIISRYAKKYH